MMRVVVLGASGSIGKALTAQLEARGIDVVEAQRSSGVDAYAGTGLEQAFAGADVVVDCTNITTRKAAKAVDFFSTVATNVAAAAHAAGVGRVMCLSIINVADPQVNAKFGYYQGKSAQERVYRDTLDDDVLTIVRSAQWYELAGQLMSTLKVGPLAAVPHMRCRPLSVDDAASALADAVITRPTTDIEVAGPDVLDLADIGKAIARKSGSPKWVVAVRVGGPAIRNGGLVPDAPTIIAPTTLNDWLDKEYAA